MFNAGARRRHVAAVGTRVVVLVEGPSKRSTEALPTWTGRADNNMRVVLADVDAAPSLGQVASPSPQAALPTQLGGVPLAWQALPSAQHSGRSPHLEHLREDGTAADVWAGFDFSARQTGGVPLASGQYVVADVVAAGGKSLYAVPVAVTSLAEAAAAGLL